MRRSNQMRFLRMEGLRNTWSSTVWTASPSWQLTNYHLAKEMLENTPAHEIKPAPLLTGDDLIALGYKPGPEFKTILRAVKMLS